MQLVVTSNYSPEPPPVPPPLHYNRLTPPVLPPRTRPSSSLQHQANLQPPPPPPSLRTPRPRPTPSLNSGRHQTPPPLPPKPFSNSHHGKKTPNGDRPASCPLHDPPQLLSNFARVSSPPAGNASSQRHNFGSPVNIQPPTVFSDNLRKPRAHRPSSREKRCPKSCMGTDDFSCYHHHHKLSVLKPADRCTCTSPHSHRHSHSHPHQGAASISPHCTLKRSTSRPRNDYRPQPTSATFAGSSSGHFPVHGDTSPMATTPPLDCSPVVMCSSVIKQNTNGIRAKFARRLGRLFSRSDKKGHLPSSGTTSPPSTKDVGSMTPASSSSRHRRAHSLQRYHEPPSSGVSCTPSHDTPAEVLCSRCRESTTPVPSLNSRPSPVHLRTSRSRRGAKTPEEDLRKTPPAPSSTTPTMGSLPRGSSTGGRLASTTDSSSPIGNHHHHHHHHHRSSSSSHQQSSTSATATVSGGVVASGNGGGANNSSSSSSRRHRHHRQRSHSGTPIDNSSGRLDTSVSAKFMENMKALKKMGWYWGPLNFEQAEEQLRERRDGCFLVRDSAHESYILSLTFRARGRTYHTRIEHTSGKFRFWAQPESHSAETVVEFIEKAVEHSKNGNFHYFLQATDQGQPPIQVTLLEPISRLQKVQRLQQICRFEILRNVRRDRINRLPMPTTLKEYLLEKQYFTELNIS